MQLKPIQNRFIKRLGTLQAGVLLMVAVAIASMAGTAFPYEKSLHWVFYSWWFRLLLLCLAANLTLCTYQALASRVLPSLRAHCPKSADYYENGPNRFSLDSPRSPDEIEAILFRNGYRVSREENYFCARKGLVAAFWVPLAHVGFVIVLIGGFLTGLVALHGRVRLNVGESTNTMILDGNPSFEQPLGFTVRCLDFQTATFPKTQIASRFVTTLEISDGARQIVGPVEVNTALKYRGLKFHQSSFGEVPGQSRYRVAVTDPGTSKTAEAVAGVGQRAHLDALGRDLLLTASLAGVRYSILDGEKAEAAGALGKDAADYEITAERFVSDFMMGADRQVVSRSQEMNNPALQVAWTGGGQAATRQWLFLRPDLRSFSHGAGDVPRLELERAQPGPDGKMVFTLGAFDRTTNAPLGKFTLTLGGKVRLADLGETAGATAPSSAAGGSPRRYDVRLAGTEPLYFTELAVSHNPAIPVIYFGAILTCVCIGLALSMRRVTLWVWCREPGRRLSVAVGYGRDRSTLTARVEKTLEALKR